MLGEFATNQATASNTPNELDGSIGSDSNSIIRNRKLQKAMIALVLEQRDKEKEKKNSK